jgi:redox-sensitive bicupin YhaK (pirin superfamily)
MIELVIPQRRRDLGSFEVGRVLPFAKRRMVGPYIFFDRIGPKADLAYGEFIPLPPKLGEMFEPEPVL